MKQLVKKYLKHFSFFYRYLRQRILFMLLLSVLVGFLDGIGLALFMPLLNVVGGTETAASGEDMGGMAFVIETITNLGLPLTVNIVLGGMLLIFILKGIAKYFEGTYKVVLRMLFVRILRFQMIDGLNGLRYQAFVNSDAGKIQNSLSGEAAKVVQAFIAYTGTIQALVMLAVYMVMAFASNPEFSVLVIAGGILTNLIYRSIYKLTKKLSRSAVTVGHVFQGLLIQNVHYYKYLKATDGLRGYAGKLKYFVNQIEEIQKRMGVLNSILTATREPLIMAVVVAVILIQVNLLGGNLASIILSLLFFYRSLASLMNIQTSWNTFLNNSGSIENAQEFIAELQAQGAAYPPQHLNQKISEIRLHNIDFHYVKGSPILKNVSLQISANQTIAFVGESGSGKTTLINLVVGLLDDYQGDIRVNNQSYRDFDIRTLQNKVGYITQEPVIFSETLYNNVTLWAEKTPENLSRFNDVLHKTALYDFVQTLPDKEESTLGDNGIQISGGQKQRISIARELFKNVELLLLDEATSALDSQTERTIQNNIDQLKGQYTILIVAHRLSTVRNANRIVVLDKGHIEASGTFDELVQTNDRFSKMVELQEF